MILGLSHFLLFFFWHFAREFVAWNLALRPMISNSITSSRNRTLENGSGRILACKCRDIGVNLYLSWNTTIFTTILKCFLFSLDLKLWRHIFYLSIHENSPWIHFSFISRENRDAWSQLFLFNVYFIYYFIYLTQDFRKPRRAVPP